MSCNSCAKPYSLLRKENGCPSCGFSFCSKCLNNKIFLPKLNTETKVCAKCKRATEMESSQPKKIESPNAYYKLSAQDPHTKPSGSSPGTVVSNMGSSAADDEIQMRLQKLKEDRKLAVEPVSENEIADRLNKLKGDLPKTSDEELQKRLARLKGVPVDSVQSKQPILPLPDLRTEQEQADDLMKQYMAQASIDDKYKNEFDNLVVAMESRLNNLKDTASSAKDTKSPEIESEDEEDTVRKIIEKVKADPSLQDDDDDDISVSTNHELPFCEICNEDARMRCLGCKYLFCKRCFLDHKDDDDGCDRYEPYTPPRK